jgi:hypothetical protein
MNKNANLKTQANKLSNSNIESNRPTFCTGSQQMNKPNETNKESNAGLPDLLLVKKKFVSKLDNLSSMHSLNQHENPFEFSTKNNYIQDETKLTIFSENPMAKTPKALTQRNRDLQSNTISF